MSLCLKGKTRLRATPLCQLLLTFVDIILRDLKGLLSPVVKVAWVHELIMHRVLVSDGLGILCVLFPACIIKW